MRAVASLLSIAALLAPATSRADEREGRAVEVVHVPDDDIPTIGPRHAPVTVEFFCNFNGDGNYPKAYERLLELAERHPRRLRIEFHIVGKRYSEAAYEAFDQGLFHEYARAAFGRRRIDIEAWAEQAGASYPELERALADGRHRDRIARAEALRARRGGLRSSKIVAFNGEFQTRKATNIDELEETYDAHYRRAKALLDDGVPLEEVFDHLVRAAEQRRARPPLTPGKVDALNDLDPPPLEPPQLIASPLPLDEWPSLGPPNARVVMVLACSLQSTTCRDLWRRARRARDVYADDVRLLLLPLFDDALHPDARLAHEATLCARDRGKYWELVDQIFRVHRPNQLGVDYLQAHAEKIDLDPEAFAECVNRREHSEQVDAALAALRKAGVIYTPSLIVGGRIYIGLQGLADLMAIVADELGPGLLERAGQLRRQILETLAPGLAELDTPADSGSR